MKAPCWIGLLAAVSAFAQAQPLTMADVSRARETLARSTGQTDIEKKEISGLFDQAAQQLQQEMRWKAQQVGHARTKTLIESELAAARGAAVSPIPGPPPPPPSETTQQVEEELARVRTEQASRIRLRDDLAKLQASLTRRSEEIATRRAQIRESLQSIEDEMSVLPLASASPLWEQGSRMALRARRQSLEQELQAIETERNALDLRRQLIPLQREAYLLRLEADVQLLEDLRLRRARARSRDSKNSLDNAVAQAGKLAARYPQLSNLASEIATQAAALWGPEGIEAKSDIAVLQADEMRTTAARFREITANTRRRYENSGVFSSASDWWPPRVEKYGKPREVGLLLLSYSAAETVVGREVFKLEEERDAAPAFETRLQQILAESGKKPADPDFEEFSAQARSMLQLKRSIMTEYLTSARVYVNRLADSSRAAKDLLHEIQELQSFVLQHVLISRSVTGSTIPSLRDFGNAFLWFFSPASWSAILTGFQSSATSPILWIAGLLAAVLLFLLRGRLREGIVRFESTRAGTKRIRTLFLSILLALLWALPAPLAIAYLGWMIGDIGGGVDLGRAIAAGLGRAAILLYVAQLVRQILADGGATDRLMGWSPAVREQLDWAVRRLTLFFTPPYVVAAALAEDGMFFNGDAALVSHHNSLGRLCFVGAVFALLYFGRKVLRPDGAVAGALGLRFSKHGIARARGARVAVKLVCWLAILLALLGYYITAYLLIHNTLRTAALTLILALLAALLRQWRIDQEERISGSRSPQEQEKARQADLQVRRLSHFGFTLVWIAGVLIIWSAALPALSMFSRVQLLPEFKVTLDRLPAPGTPAAPQAAPQAAPKNEMQEEPPAAIPGVPLRTPPSQGQAAGPRQALYLSDLLLALFVGILTSMLISNIPGVLQFTVFRRLQLDEGGQYAVNTIARYLVIIAALVIVSAILGVDWNKVQWLAAALTFGIGFGLQEIFANFAAGLILLLDRSIRVGDAVTVGSLSGVVARIQMRATTVTLWDHSDMVVPNKEFITTKLVNWTLSHPDTRVDLKVGVDYSSDVEQVREVLMRLAEEHPAVLKEPAPQVLLTEFADSAIVFELRVFALYSYGRPVLLDELHRAVAKEFRRLGISIAFPQLDVHLNRAPPTREPER
jgi:potassium efflux system protein